MIPYSDSKTDIKEKNMRNIKLTIEYDGKRYLGWQRLGDSDKTIQGKIENIIHQMTGEKIEIIGSGRTDSGAHAKGQVANFKTESELSTGEMIEFLNRYLPQDIVIKEVKDVSDRFHARYNATGKTYTYQVWTNKIPSAFERGYSYHYPARLDLDKMNQACEKLVGKHDFLGFSSLKKTKKSTVRTIEEIKINQKGDLLEVSITGDGFLYNMVRIIMGTLLEIGSGKRPVESIDEIFEQKVRQDAGETIPAQGLFLDEVYYS